MSFLRTGVIGVGHLGYHHARVYAGLEGVTLAGVVDIDAARGNKAANDFNTVWFRSVADLIKAGVDAVSVAVPTTAHCEATLELLEAGADVLVEKPIAGSVWEAGRMVEAARTRGRILQVGHIERFNGAVIALFSALTRPRFIECHRLSPYPNRGHDVSVVLDLMIHDLEIVLGLDGGPVVSLEAVGVPVFSEHEDIANARIRFASGCVANITCSRVSMDRMRKIRIFEENAYVSTDYSEQEVLVYRKRPGTFTDDTPPMERIAVERLSVNRDEPLKLELASFVDCARTGKRPIVAGEDALAALELAQRIIDRIRESS